MSNPSENNVEKKESTASNSEARGELTLDNECHSKNYRSFRKFQVCLMEVQITKIIILISSRVI